MLKSVERTWWNHKNDGQHNNTTFFTFTLNGLVASRSMICSYEIVFRKSVANDGKLDHIHKNIHCQFFMYKKIISGWFS